MRHRLFELLSVTIVALLFLLLLLLNEWSFEAAVRSVTPNFFSVFLVFIIIHFLFTRRGESLSDLAGGGLVRDEYRTKIIPASRRLEKALQRSNEAYLIITQSNDFQSDVEKLSRISYLHQVMTSDIYEAYRTLMEAWSTLETRLDMKDPLLKAREFVLQANVHCDVIHDLVETVNKSSTHGLMTALGVLKTDLNSAANSLGE